MKLKNGRKQPFPNTGIMIVLFTIYLFIMNLNTMNFSNFPFYMSNLFKSIVILIKKYKIETLNYQQGTE
jgi:uncharacterized membrane protein